MKETRELKAVIFDLDGTLLDTLEDLADSVNVVLAEFGFPPRSRQEIQNFVGNGVKRLMERALFSEDVQEGVWKQRQDALQRCQEGGALLEQAFSRMKEYYSGHCRRKTAPYPGIVKCLEELGKEGLQLAVVSNKLDGAVKELAETFFPGCFQAAVGDQEGKRPKPAPDLVELALSQLMVEPEECVYVGDSEVDIQTAANAGLPCLSVCWGFRGREFLEKNGATSLYESVQALGDALQIRHRDYRCLLFDLDGTLTDSGEGVIRSAQYALGAMGILAEEAELRRFVGPPLKASFRDFYGFSGEQVDQAVAKYRERYNAIGIFENSAYEGIRELLGELKQAGYLLGVATSKPEVMAYRVLEKYELLAHFDVVTGSELDGTRSEKSEVIEEALRRMERAQKEGETGVGDGMRGHTLMIGDRKYDAAGAQEAGLACIGVYYGYAEQGELEAAGADFVAATVDDLGMLLLAGRR